MDELNPTVREQEIYEEMELTPEMVKSIRTLCGTCLRQNCTSMLLCAKPAAGCSAAGFVQGMVVWLGQRCMTT